MNKVQQEKKKEIASSLVELLQKLNLKDTADVLIEEAALMRDKNMEEDIKEILQDQNIEEEDKQQAIENYCKYSIQNYLRENKIDQALQIYQVIVPIYCERKMDEFSLLFAENYQKDGEKVRLLLQNFMGQTKFLPENRIGCLDFKNEIWYLRLIGNDILVIDCLNNAYIVQDNIVRCKKQRIHSQKIFALTVWEEKFASGGSDKFVKVWDRNITLLHCIQLHKDRINGIVMFNETIVSFDNDAIICVHQTPSLGKLERKAIFKTVNPFICVKYARNKNKIVAVSNANKFGQICFVNIEKKRVQKILQIDKKIYGIQLSNNQKMVFANVAPAQIRVYSLSSKHDLLHKLTGFVQIKNLMRMTQCDAQGKYLAVTSQEGTVRIYSLKEQQQVLKLIGQSKKSINCIIAKNSELFFGCDGGKLEHWSNVVQKQENRRKRTLSSQLITEHEASKARKIHAK